MRATASIAVWTRLAGASVTIKTPDQDNAHGQILTKSDVIWVWWRNGSITRDDAVVYQGRYQFTMRDFHDLVNQHDGANHSPTPRNRDLQKKRDKLTARF